MKELSVEEKAKAYDEALERAREEMSKEGLKNDVIAVHLVETIFPELKEESEDERIWKELITHCRNTRCVTEEGAEKIAKWIAFLEKQGEKSLTVDIESMIKSYEQRLINQGNGVKNSPIVNMCVAAFKHGVENTLDELHLKQGETSPILSNSSNIGKDEQKPTIEMKSAEESLGIDSETYNKIVDECIYGERKLDTDFSDLRTWKYIVDAVWTEKEGIGQYLDSPFTEEVAKKLQKRFGNIEQKSQRMVSAEAKEAMYDKPAWSEEDENTIKVLMNIIKKSEIIDSIIYTDSLKEKLYDWLKSLRPQPKQEWSEEDEKMLNRIIEDFSDGKVSNILEVYWLKSIEQRLRG